MAFKIAIFVGAFFIGHGAAWADDPCDAVLVPAHIASSSNYAAKLASLEITDKQQFDVNKKSASGNGSYAEIYKGSGKYDEFRDKTEKLFHYFDLNWSEQTSRAMVASYVPDSNVKAWSDCMRNGNRVAADPRNVTDQAFTLEVRWTVPPAVPLPQKLSVDLTGGVFDKTKTSSLVETENGTFERFWTIDRNSNQDVRVVVGIADTGADFVVPKPVKIEDPAVTIKVSGDYNDGSLHNIPEKRRPLNFTISSAGVIKDYNLTIKEFVDSKECTDGETQLSIGAQNSPAGTTMSSTRSYREATQSGCQVTVDGKNIQCFVDPMWFYNCHL